MFMHYKKMMIKYRKIMKNIKCLKLLVLILIQHFWMNHTYNDRLDVLMS